MMTTYSRRIDELKTAVRAMLDESRRQQGETTAASAIWAEVIGVHGYLMNLSAEDLRSIVFHSTLVTGTGWPYWHAYPEPDPAEEAARLGYLRAVCGVPETYWVGECRTPTIPRPLGVCFRERIININVVRYQTCVSSLYHAGVFDAIDRQDGRRVLVEIGPGHGCLSRALSDILRQRATCVLVDLPGMFLFSGAYLAAHRPDRRVYIYHPDTWTADFVATRLTDYDFVLLPNYRVRELAGLDGVAAMMNVRSFQEMTQSQVEEYLDLAGSWPEAVVYSDNLDRHPHNSALRSLTEALASRFVLRPAREYYDRLYDGQDIRRYGHHKQFIGLPRAGAGTFAPYPTAHLQHQPRTSPGAGWSAVRKLLPKPWRSALRRYAAAVLDT